MPENFSVLIVEDDDDARRNMSDILSLDGYKTRLESRCLTAINAIESESFDAVILDWRLPDENADSLLPIIVEHQPDTPIVVVTGLRDFDTSVKALRSGAYDFLLKPINADALRSVLARLVERKKHLREIQDGQEQLLVNERLAAIGQMVAGLAHESRNAFQRSHACLAELALDLEGKPDSLKLVYKIQKALDDVHHLLEEVRDYSAPIVLERRPCNLEDLVGETWQQIKDAGKSASYPDLKIAKADNMPVDGRLDLDRIRQVMRNLLENALFANNGTGVVRVNLEFSDSANPILRIKVIDQGQGVSEDQRDKIFNPFFTTKTKGTGLGLALSRRIVSAHGGRIDVENSQETGATFFVELPYRTR